MMKPSSNIAYAMISACATDSRRSGMEKRNVATRESLKRCASNSGDGHVTTSPSVRGSVSG